MSELAALMKANADFYAAFTQGDQEGMSRLWADGEVSCIHPGWPALVGREAVMRSWRDILGNAERGVLECLDVVARVEGAHGRVLCIEKLGGSVLAATNIFIRVEKSWRLLHHHAGPISVPTQAIEAPPAGSLLH